MNVALVWVPPDPLCAITVRYERYVRGFRSLGWNPITVCLPSAAVGYTEQLVVAKSKDVLSDPAFYRSLDCQIGVAVTWLGLPEVVRAMKSSIPWVVSIADSDGQVGACVYPKETLKKAISQHCSLLMKIRALKYWMQQYLAPEKKNRNNILLSADASDRITVTSPFAFENLRKFFLYYRRHDLVKKITVVPYPIDNYFLSGSVPTTIERPNRVVAIGRWDDPQKDAALLAKGMAWASVRSPKTEFLVVGKKFDKWLEQYRFINYIGVKTSSQINEVLKSSRILLVTSRWESGPIVAFEAVCSGASIVGPNWVPACRWLTNGGGGMTFASHSAKAVGSALLKELAAWNCGERDPRLISTYWRPLFDPANVCYQMLSRKE